MARDERRAAGGGHRGRGRSCWSGRSPMTSKRSASKRRKLLVMGLMLSLTASSCQEAETPDGRGRRVEPAPTAEPAPREQIGSEPELEAADEAPEGGPEEESSGVRIPRIRGLGFRWDVQQRVPKEDLELIETGMALGVAYTRALYGGAIPPPVRKQISIKVVADGSGNTERGGGGACCTGTSVLTHPTPRPFFDVLHPDWSSAPPSYKVKLAVHEYVHAWQATMGCYSVYSQPLGDWINEGIAEHIAFDAVVGEGLVGTRAEHPVTRALLNARADGSIQHPLSAYDVPGQSPAHAGHIGFIAIDMLVEQAHRGKLALRRICERVAEGAGVDGAFEQVFGISRASFYTEFEEWRGNVGT